MIHQCPPSTVAGRTAFARLAVAVLIVLVAGCPAYAGVEAGAVCEERKARATGRAAADVLKAHAKNAKKPDAARFVDAILRARSKLTESFTKAEVSGGCPTGGEASAIGGKVDAFVAEITGGLSPVCGDGIRSETTEDCDGPDDGACPGLCRANCTCGPGCGNRVIEGGEQCDPPCEQGGCPSGQVCNGLCECEPIAPCDCGEPSPPTLLRFTTTAGAGSCGTAWNATGTPVLDLACGGLYIGGGSGDLPVPALNPDQGTNLYSVACCNGTSVTLGPTIAGETGTVKTCSGQGCFFGAPQPVINRANLFLSTCLVHTITRNSRGSLDCATGASQTARPLGSDTHLHGVDLSTEPGWQACPICVGGTLGVQGSGTCKGGPNNGLACEPGSTQIDVHDCCNGGPLNGRLCSDDSECAGASCVENCSGFPTSQDCPPNPVNSIGTLDIPLALTTATSSKTADARGTFCGFCRDVLIEASLCFEGDPDVTHRGCPDSQTIGCRPESGSELRECGTAVPCQSDADCAAPYETCEQRNPGAFRDAGIRFLSTAGVPGGSLKDRAEHDSTVVGVFCIEPSFTPSIDQSSDLGGPGAASLVGRTQLLPQ